MAVFGLLIAAATIVGFAGRWSWIFDLTASFRPHYTLLLLFCAGAMAVGRYWGSAVFCALGAAVNMAVVAPLFMSAPGNANGSDDVLRLMALNVKIRGADQGALIDYLSTADDDVVFLFATNDKWADALESSDIPYDVVVSRPKGMDLEILVLSRVPISGATIHDWGSTSRSRAVEVRLERDGEPVTLLGMHPVSPGPSRASLRTEQFGLISEWAAAQDGAYVVLGDLNATPWSHTFRNLLSRGRLTNSQLGYGLQPTWPAKLGPLGIPIDHVLHSEDMITADRSLGPSFGSEHRSIRVSLALASGRALDSG